MVSVLVILLIAFTVIALAFNFKSTGETKEKIKKLEEDFENAKIRILNLENKFQEKLNKFNEDLEKQKKTMKDINMELQNVRNYET